MIVVTGATGNVGTPLVQALVEAGEEVTAVSRREVEAPPGVRSVRADLAEPASLERVFARAEAVFLLTAPEFLAGGDLGPVVDLAQASGVARLVLLSSQGVGTQRHPPAMEDAVTRSDLEWTVLRPGNFASNALRWAGDVRSRRTVAA
ncbi:SDR family oxidoreductase, partial [Pseudonocardia pini]|uniref:SDR family oxidoreductase n=1 Tax=Pseudonocardia pini TaxID=2758030 RepID=UPI0015F03BFA